MYLVDTNVVSEAAPTKKNPSAELLAWMDYNARSLFMSVITVAEIEDGISRNQHQGAPRKAARLADWLETVLHLYSNRILQLDISIARLAGRMSGQARAVGVAPGFPDLVIAATAQLRGYTVLTRNLRDFDATGVPTHDPFLSLP